jgi:predicted O-linked N-acetylglucosamine transferase (SPINDLY family)
MMVLVGSTTSVLTLFTKILECIAMLITDSIVTDRHHREEDIDSCWQFCVESIIADDPDEAHASLLIPFLNIETKEEEELLQGSLMQYLQLTADRQEETGCIENSCKLMSFAQELFPEDINILLRLIDLAVQTRVFSFEMLVEKQLLLLLADARPESIDQDRLYKVVQSSLRLFTASLGDSLSESFFPNLTTLFLEKTLQRYDALEMILAEAFLLAQQRHLTNLRVLILEACLESCDSKMRFRVMCQLSTATAFAGQYAKSMQIAEQLYEEFHQESSLHAIVASHHLFYCLMEAGNWQRISIIAPIYQASIKKLTSGNCFDSEELGMMVTFGFLLNYIYDQPRLLHDIRNSVGKIVVPLSIAADRETAPPRSIKALVPCQKVLHIGYIASTLTKHSVGWLSRWIFSYHNHQDFKVFAYNVCGNDRDDFNRKYFQDRADQSHYFGMDAAAIVKQIQEDEIDILVDLDSLTSSVTYEVMCCKPAPIQVTWLGWDASGCPEIDYFIADPHVLPADAEEYYQTRIWRLPQTYIAIDGFEVDTPTKRREDYGIPSDAIVYFCGQKSFKHHPDILRLQMQIIREVPNSYLLVKLRGDRDSLVKTYQSLADEVGISMDRLRFLDSDPDEYTHRANLNIADVVLDTFPYNGATTTLETIWAGVPMVTKVGQAFVARNSYAFLTNAGISEGIAYTDEEYINWGIELGTNSELRRQISGKMLHSRKTSPLWNAKQFTLEIESAYRKMWEIHEAQLDNIPSKIYQ